MVVVGGGVGALNVETSLCNIDFKPFIFCAFEEMSSNARESSEIADLALDYGVNQLGRSLTATVVGGKSKKNAT